MFALKVKSGKIWWKNYFLQPTQTQLILITTSIISNLFPANLIQPFRNQQHRLPPEKIFTILCNLWEIIITGESLLVFGESTSQISRAVVALVELISPLTYAGEYYPYFTIHDTMLHAWHNYHSHTINSQQNKSNNNNKEAAPQRPKSTFHIGVHSNKTAAAVPDPVMDLDSDHPLADPVLPDHVIDEADLKPQLHSHLHAMEFHAVTTIQTKPVSATLYKQILSAQDKENLRKFPCAVVGVTNPIFVKTLEEWPNQLILGGQVLDFHNLKKNVTKNFTLKTRLGILVDFQWKSFQENLQKIEKEKLSVQGMKSLIESPFTLFFFFSDEKIAKSNLVRSYFYFLTQRFMAPLERYFSKLIPKQRLVKIFGDGICDSILVLLLVSLNSPSFPFLMKMNFFRKFPSPPEVFWEAKLSEKRSCTSDS
jgi:hypothetical protein